MSIVSSCPESFVPLSQTVIFHLTPVLGYQIPGEAILTSVPAIPTMSAQQCPYSWLLSVSLLEPLSSAYGFPSVFFTRNWHPVNLQLGSVEVDLNAPFYGQIRQLQQVKHLPQPCSGSSSAEFHSHSFPRAVNLTQTKCLKAIIPALHVKGLGLSAGTKKWGNTLNPKV